MINSTILRNHLVCKSSGQQKQLRKQCRSFLYGLKRSFMNSHTGQIQFLGKKSSDSYELAAPKLQIAEVVLETWWIRGPMILFHVSNHIIEQLSKMRSFEFDSDFLKFRYAGLWNHVVRKSSRQQKQLRRQRRSFLYGLKRSFMDSHPGQIQFLSKKNLNFLAKALD